MTDPRMCLKSVGTAQVGKGQWVVTWSDSHSGMQLVPRDPSGPWSLGQPLLARSHSNIYNLPPVARRYIHVLPEGGRRAVEVPAEGTWASLNLRLPFTPRPAPQAEFPRACRAGAMYVMSGAGGAEQTQGAGSAVEGGGGAQRHG